MRSNLLTQKKIGSLGEFTNLRYGSVATDPQSNELTGLFPRNRTLQGLRSLQKSYISSSNMEFKERLQYVLKSINCPDHINLSDIEDRQKFIDAVSNHIDSQKKLRDTLVRQIEREMEILKFHKDEELREYEIEMEKARKKIEVLEDEVELQDQIDKNNRITRENGRGNFKNTYIYFSSLKKSMEDAIKLKTNMKDTEIEEIFNSLKLGSNTIERSIGNLIMGWDTLRKETVELSDDNNQSHPEHYDLDGMGIQIGGISNSLAKQAPTLPDRSLPSATVLESEKKSVISLVKNHKESFMNTIEVQKTRIYEGAIPISNIDNNSFLPDFKADSSRVGISQVTQNNKFDPIAKELINIFKDLQNRPGSSPSLEISNLSSADQFNQKIRHEIPKVIKVILETMVNNRTPLQEVLPELDKEIAERFTAVYETGRWVKQAHEQIDRKIDEINSYEIILATREMELTQREAFVQEIEHKMSSQGEKISVDHSIIELRTRINELEIMNERQRREKEKVDSKVENLKLAIEEAHHRYQELSNWASEKGYIAPIHEVIEEHGTIYLL